MGLDLDRRHFLRGAACSLAAHPAMTGVTLARTGHQARLVVILLPGAMDGMDLFQPWGDPDFADLRPGHAIGPGAGGVDLGRGWALGPQAADLAPLWDEGGLAGIHAVATPYRDGRSHFEGQDLLEAGTVAMNGVRDGWLNRALGALPRGAEVAALAVAPGDMALLRGAAPVLNWSPLTRLPLSPQTQRLLTEVFHDDPLFQAAGAEAMDLAARMPDPVADTGDLRRSKELARGSDAAALAGFVAGELRRDTRIAAFSLTGWDTHANQSRELRRPMGDLVTVLTTLRADLRPVWDDTAIIAMTEFGRAARLNGSGGTDHGTGGAAVLAGGAIRGGRIWGDWPGLGPGDLLAQRDLRPTSDVRLHAATLLHTLFGLDWATLTSMVFPGLDAQGQRFDLTL